MNSVDRINEQFEETNLTSFTSIIFTVAELGRIVTMF